MLDELGALGWLTWAGHGALGKQDGRVAFYRRERVGLLLDPPEEPADLDPLHRTILDHLRVRGASFFVEIQSACGAEARVRDVREALWDLVWHGLVTNDTLAALRAYGQPQRSGSGRRPGTHASIGGRWSLVAELVRSDATQTERAHARAVTLLERHGIVAREVAALEPGRGGFSAIYRVLRAMEEGGKVRRGYFVEGLGGAQFASPGAVDRLRAARNTAEHDVLVLSALDPANPYGWLLPWPVREGSTVATPRRVAGAAVVLVDGVATLYVDRGGRRLLTFPAADDPDVEIAAARALTRVAARHRGKILRIEKIDGEPARTSPHAERLRAADFTSDPRGLLLEGR
jgi:ATP-dependent Lhr-like helicase